MEHFVYILKCCDGTLYTGYTTDVERRLKEHNSSDRGAKYTRGRRPCVLVHIEQFPSKEEALKREYFIKHKMSHEEKAALTGA
ncbi:MAG: GIY-YIG nuclease family protein [Lachnospiraceae bacterium]|nr:GIY-YIG nuclease family protein [Lachnospiraceae bacterium]